MDKEIKDEGLQSTPAFAKLPVMRCASCKYFSTGNFTHNTDVFHSEDGCRIENDVAEKDYGICLNEKVSSDYVDDWMKRKVDKSSDGIYATCDEGRGHLEVGKDFGCVHWHSA